MFSTVQEIPKAEPQIVSTGFPASPPSSGQMTLGNRQVAAVSFVILTMLALVASVAYLAGRMVTPVITTATEAKAPESRAPEQVYVVNSAQTVTPAALSTAAPAVTAAPATAAPMAIRPTPAASPAASSIPAPASSAPVVSALSFRPVYWQVASVDRGMAEVSVEYLKKKGLPAVMAAGASPSVFRVLVGPADNSEAAARLKEELTQLGFTPFPKRK
jgi:hypothetical protein